MEIHRISRQGKETLREFYALARPGLFVGDTASRMLALLDHLETADHPPVWGFTSWTRLFLTERDDPVEWLVSIVAAGRADLGEPHFRIAYALPAPWYSAHGCTDDLGEATALVIDGLRQACRGKHRNVTFEW
jgi:hypothetical protein